MISFFKNLLSRLFRRKHPEPIPDGEAGDKTELTAKDLLPTESAAESDVLINSCYDNRELSWLKFNTRVLEEAETPLNPLGERLSFLSIFQSNLDEFFRVRVGSLFDQMLISEDIRDSKTHMTCAEQLAAIFSQTRTLTQRKDHDFTVLKKELSLHSVELLEYGEMEEQDRIFLRTFFKQSIRPLLAPLVIGKKQPFPFLNNQDIYVIAILEANGKEKLGIVPCSGEMFPRLVRISGRENRFILTEELILHFTGKIFGNYNVKAKSLIRLLRNADIDPDEDVYDDEADFRNIMEQLVSQRKRLRPIKLEYTRPLDAGILKALCQQLGMEESHVFRSQAPLDLSFFSEIRDILRGDTALFFDRFSPQIPREINLRGSMLEQIEEKDRLLFYPYDSMDPFLKMLTEAAEHPDVVSIRMTLYRVASHSRVVSELIRAAENGKEVDVLVELRARFDEANNIDWSRRLEEAGCRILYGLDNLKVHSKLCLVTMRKEESNFYYTQIGTGNYNETTARLYTDFSLMTAHQGIGAEANKVFQQLFLGEVMTETKHLLIAPRALREPILQKIDRQIALAGNGKPAYVGAKMNSLTDKTIIDKLIEASQAGVEIELIVRGACCLIAGIPGMTDHITIRSIVGRYLEHSRIYIFGADGEEVYLSSADFMTRNTIRRVEVAAPVYDPDVKARVLHIFAALMADNVKARVQQPNGNYVPANDNDDEKTSAHSLDENHTPVSGSGKPLSAQEYFQSQKNR
ncbi:MAG: polyphosphate kinase 1 [Clostridiales bacterium]|nr:polyphosphate kinase 1 [Clostridiales bacterium]